MNISLAAASRADDTREKAELIALVRQLTPKEVDRVVKRMQALLNGLGYNAGTADGLFGGNTAGAVKRFQAASGIAADGIVGRDTWHKLLGI